MENRKIAIQLSQRVTTLSLAEEQCFTLLNGFDHVKCSAEMNLKDPPHKNLLGFLTLSAKALQLAGEPQLYEAVNEVIHQSIANPDFGGYGFETETPLSPEEEKEVVFLLSAYLQALKSASRASSPPKLLSSRPSGRPGMTMTEKIFAMHDVSRKGFVKPGDVIQVDVDWILASELSWKVVQP